MHFPGDSDGEGSFCNTEDLGQEEPPGEGMATIQVFLPGELLIKLYCYLGK